MFTLHMHRMSFYFLHPTSFSAWLALHPDWPDVASRDVDPGIGIPGLYQSRTLGLGYPGSRNLD